MKKVALLFTILCASALNGMDTKRSSWDYLPQDIRYVIINAALKASDTLDGAIKAIKRLSVVQGAQLDKLFANQKDFTKLVQMLANKYNISSSFVGISLHTINESAIETYWKLMNALIDAVINSREEEVSQLIADGADVNTDAPSGGEGSVKIWRLAIAKPNILKILLQAGAQISQKDIDYIDDLSDIIKSAKIAPMAIEITKSLELIKEAVQKQ